MPKINPKKLTDSIKNLKNNLYVKHYQQRDGFFELGAGNKNQDEGMKQFRKDYIERDFQVNGTHFANDAHIKDKLLTDEEIKKILEKKFPDNSDAVIKGNTQAVGSVIQFLLYGLTSDIVDNNGLMNTQAAWQSSDKNNNPKINLYSENNKIYATCKYHDLSVNDEKDENRAIGSFGPITARFVLINKNNRWGFQLEYIEANSKFLCSILDGTQKKSANEIRNASVSELRLQAIKNFITAQKWPDNKIPRYLNAYLTKIEMENDPAKTLSDITNSLREIITAKLSIPTHKLFSAKQSNNPLAGDLLNLISSLETSQSQSESESESNTKETPHTMQFR